MKKYKEDILYSRYLERKKIGYLGELLVCIELMRHGWLPQLLYFNAPHDIIAYKGNRSITVQVKATTGKAFVAAYRNGTFFDSVGADYLFLIQINDLFAKKGLFIIPRKHYPLKNILRISELNDFWENWKCVRIRP